MSTLDEEDIDLEYTRDLRKKLVTNMTSDGMPKDTKDKAILLATLDGIDRAALTKKRIKSDEGISNVKAVAAETIAQIFMDARLKSLGESREVLHRAAPLLGDDLPMPEIVEGELDSSSPHDNFASFMKRNGLNSEPGQSDELGED